MKRFNIRVYGVCINKRNEVLLSNETHQELAFTKFPGGGLEWGEAPIDCLKREFKEEFDLDIEVGDLIYLTDFFQVSAFSENDQVISIYYAVHVDENLVDEVINKNESEEKLQWLYTELLDPDLFTFPIDKKVAQIIYQSI